MREYIQWLIIVWKRIKKKRQKENKQTQIIIVRKGTYNPWDFQQKLLLWVNDIGESAWTKTAVMYDDLGYPKGPIY